MLGPIDVKNLVLCTTSRSSELSRYAAARLSTELPGVKLHVYYQDPQTNPDELLSSVSSPANWKRRYWQFRADCRRPRWAFCTYFFLKLWQRKVNRLFRKAGHTDAKPTSAHDVRSVNLHANDIAALDPDVLLILGGQKVSKEVLATAKIALNIHCGKLPSYRGVKSVFFALAEQRPDQVGVTLHEATSHLDAGRIVHWRQVPPASTASIPELLFLLTRTGLDLAIDTVRGLSSGPVPIWPQSGEPRMFRMKDFDEDLVYRARHAFRNRTNRRLRSRPGAS